MLFPLSSEEFSKATSLLESWIWIKRDRYRGYYDLCQWIDANGNFLDQNTFFDDHSYPNKYIFDCLEHQREEVIKTSALFTLYYKAFFERLTTVEKLRNNYNFLTRRALYWLEKKPIIVEDQSFLPQLFLEELEKCRTNFKKALDQLNFNDKQGLVLKSSQGEILCLNPCRNLNIGVISDNPEQGASCLRRLITEAVSQNVPVTLFGTQSAFYAEAFDLFGQASNIFEIPEFIRPPKYPGHEESIKTFDVPHAHTRYVDFLAASLAELVLKRSSIFGFAVREIVIVRVMEILLKGFFDDPRIKKRYQETVETEAESERLEPPTFRDFVNFIYRLYLEPNPGLDLVQCQKYLEPVWLSLSTWLSHPSITLITGNSEAIGLVCNLRTPNSLDDEDHKLLQTISVFSAALKRTYATQGVICVIDVDFADPLVEQVLASLIMQGKKLGITVFYSTTPKSVFESPRGRAVLINTDVVFAGQIESSCQIPQQGISKRGVEFLQNQIQANNFLDDDQAYFLSYGQKLLSGCYKFVS